MYIYKLIVTLLIKYVANVYRVYVTLIIIVLPLRCTFVLDKHFVEQFHYGCVSSSGIKYYA